MQEGVCPIVNAPAGRLLGAYDLGVVTPRAVVHAGDKTSRDARSWYMISGDAKSWVVIVKRMIIKLTDYTFLYCCPSAVTMVELRNWYAFSLWRMPSMKDIRGDVSGVVPLRSLSLYTLGVCMSWEDFKTLTREEFCLSNEMQKLETELWNHAMVGASHSTYTDRFRELARLVPHLVISEGKRIKRNGSIKKNHEKRGNRGEPSKDRNVRDDNKRTRTGNAFPTTTNPIRRENMGTDKSKITRKQSKAGKHGHENQKSTKPKPKISSPILSQFPFVTSTRTNLAIYESYC
ncbi:reverse transcriptase domain-containing protein [Tanacetum coccineum]